jgi:hypothetical protein
MSEIKEQVLQASRERIWLDQEVEAYYKKIANDFSGLEICELEHGFSSEQIGPWGFYLESRSLRLK